MVPGEWSPEILHGRPGGDEDDGRHPIRQDVAEPLQLGIWFASEAAALAHQFVQAIQILERWTAVRLDGRHHRGLPL